ncbi:carbamoyltransferase HypF [Megasphaera sp. DISK 18]|uniref:carbamoyltransferase HypF n=1 Tax=Megasphaera sp. DISK 18 TaxID=1776081 RepID=UPI0008070F2C|nr:carbamoyltransferase HypF [Megasphaera sp. DISK 18]OBZ32993.1 carbamoyltransferase HypF [Megasphaera sp. DISK 18]
MRSERICVFGIVQGVGFRPFVSRIADANGIFGSVCNKGSYVEIIAQGDDAQLAAFHEDLEKKAPERSSILKVVTTAVEIPAYDDFSIIESAREKGDIFVSPDIAICKACQKELFDKNDRRYLHPFINCTACGPRLTILDSMPYDRERTSMGEFPMCPQCEYEYTHAETRRYDAQPVCCNDCGPEVYLLDRKERGREAITTIRKAIVDGKIVAIKGIGGFHLCCDARNEEAVSALRERKGRPVKPFAVMMKDVDAVRRECLIPDGAEDVLDGHQKPIILLAKRDGLTLAPSVAPGNPSIGVMLPYTPLHLLLFTYDDGLEVPDSLVMTSANESGAPICHNDEEARQELSGLADLVLSHNRRIRLRADDSVMDWYDGKPYMIRRSRGYAPLPFFYGSGQGKDVLAIGGELKNCFCIGRNNLFYPSPYIGDMSDIRTVQALRDSVQRMASLLEASPSVVACDLHPAYNTAAVARELGLPVVTVQHHYAHILSCMAENDCEQPVIGVSFDGTGYGSDGTIWGGEILISSLQGFERAASIEPFWQRGGDVSAKEGWRIAVSLIDGLWKDRQRVASMVEDLKLCGSKELAAQFFLADQQINSVISTSAGRLFDGVSAILGLCRSSTFEGQAAMTLQFAAERWERDHGAMEVVPVEPIEGDGRWLLPTSSLVKNLVEQRLSGDDPDKLAYEFHCRLAGMAVGICENVRRDTGLERVALSGGVFQNRLLLRLCDEALQQRGFTVLRHSLVPPNDGGIALGQAIYAMYHENV